MSKIIQIGEHNWQLPIYPAKQEEVLFQKESKKNQYWRRNTVDFPKYFFDWNYETKLFADITRYDDEDVLISLNAEHSRKFIELREREMQRRVQGIWFMNDGDLTYLTGGHYFFLQWGQLAGYMNPDDGTPYGEYREFQRDFAYFLQMCKEEPECTGGYCVKPKKTGITQYLAIDYLDESTRYKGKVLGMMSKAQVPDCRDTNFMYYKYALEGLPMCMRPSIANENLTQIIFGNPVGAKATSRRAGRNMNGNMEYLNSRVFCAPTKTTGFDGPKMFRAWCDEFPKYKDPSPDDVYKRSNAAVKLQQKVEGKYWITSYPPEDDDASFKQGRKIYFDSKLRTKGSTGRTKSELYAYCISSLDSQEGTFNRFGKADKVKANHYIVTNLDDKKNDPADLQTFQRQNPRDETEAWRSGGGSGSVFDNMRLNDRKFELEEAARIGDIPYTEGNLRWVKERFGPVEFISLTEEDKLNKKEGRWKMHRMHLMDPESYNIPYTAQIKDRQGRLKPQKPAKYVGGFDPTNYNVKKHVLKGSRNGLWVMNLPDAALNSQHDTLASDRMVCEYLYRQERPKDTYEDVLLSIFYFGMPIIIESNMGWVASMLIEDNLQNFLLVRDSNKAIVPYDETKHQKLVTTTKSGISDVINELVLIATEFLADHRNLQNIDSIDLIDDLMEFDSQDTKPYDSAISFMYCLLAKVGYLAWLKKSNSSSSIYDPYVMRRITNELMD